MVNSLGCFWNDINKAFMSTLQTDKSLNDYVNQTSNYDTIQVLILESDDARYNPCKLIYNHFTRTLHNKLTDPLIINKDQAPNAYNEL